MNYDGGRNRFHEVNTKECERFLSPQNEIRTFSRERQQQEVTAVNTWESKSGRDAPPCVNKTGDDANPWNYTVQSDRFGLAIQERVKTLGNVAAIK